MSPCQKEFNQGRLGRLRSPAARVALARLSSPLISLSLAQQFGKRNGPVVAIDLDLGCGNLNACLGVRSPNGTISSFLSRKAPSLQHILTPTQQKHLQVICSSYSGSPEKALTDSLKKELLDEASALEASWVLMDLGAGTSTDVLDLFLGATEKIIVITPEALSLHNAFLFLKTLILHYLWRELGKEGLLSAVKPTWQKMIDDRQDIIIPELIDHIRDWGPLRGLCFDRSDQRSQDQVPG